MFSQSRESEIVTLEELDDKDQDWYDQRQFITSSADLNLKLAIVERIDRFGGDWFSLVSDQASIAPDAVIGKGVSIFEFTHLHTYGVIVDDHVFVATGCMLSHQTHIGKYSYICPYTYTCFTTFGQGNYVGLRSSFLGTADSAITTADWSNFLMESRVNMSLTESGTYQGHRLRSIDTTLSRKIF